MEKATLFFMNMIHVFSLLTKLPFIIPYFKIKLYFVKQEIN